MCGGRAAVGNGNTVDCAGPITGALMTVDGHDSLDTRASYEGFRRLHEVLQSRSRPLLGPVRFDLSITHQCRLLTMGEHLIK